MTDLRAAAQQALEAMDKATRFMSDSDYMKLNQAIETLKAALAQQEQEPVEIKPPNPEGATQCIVRWLAETPAGWVGAWDREALERFTAHPPRREWQQEQEPVAWIDDSGHPKHRLYLQSATEKRLYGPLRPLYAVPPRREWVSLTEEELRDALRECPHDTVENLRVRWLYAKDFARAIEQALKEKNNG